MKNDIKLSVLTVDLKCDNFAESSADPIVRLTQVDALIVFSDVFDVKTSVFECMHM